MKSQDPKALTLDQNNNAHQEDAQFNPIKRADRKTLPHFNHLAPQTHSALTSTVLEHLRSRTPDETKMTVEQFAGFPTFIEALKKNTSNNIKDGTSQGLYLNSQLESQLESQLQSQLQCGIAIKMSLTELERLIQHFQTLSNAKQIKLSDQHFMPFAFILAPDNTGTVIFFSGRVIHDGSADISVPPVNNPIIGLYGGLGTVAGIDFVKNIVGHFPEMITQANEHRDIRPCDILLLSCSATPDRTKKIEALSDEDIPSPEKDIHGGLKMLMSCGATRTCVACNTAHYWLEDTALKNSLRQHAQKNLSILKALTDELLSQNTNCPVIVLSTLGTQKTGLYRQALQERGIVEQALTETEYKKVHSIIYDQIKTGQPIQAAKALMEILERYPNAKIALCCTELGLSLNAQLTPKLYDEGRLIDNNIVSPKALIKALLTTLKSNKNESKPTQEMLFANEL